MSDAIAINPGELRRNAERLSAGFPALLARARHLAATLDMGAHGRRRAGMGDEFWQYRPAVAGDAAGAIDWRRSGRTDTEFVREQEWQTAQAVHLWVDPGAAMAFAGETGAETKALRAQLLALATAILLTQAGERVGLMDDPEPPKRGEVQLNKIIQFMMHQDDIPDYAKPPEKILSKGSRAVYLSDFLGDWSALVKSLSQAADQDVQGSLIQVLDPVEVSFPFKGRTIFQSMQNTVEFETLKANSLRDDYLARLAEREAELRDLAKATGWRYYKHVTDEDPQSALLWLYQALEYAG